MVTTCRILKVLANEARLRVVTLLIDGDKTANDLHKTLKIDRALLSHHLASLQDSGVIEMRRKGKFMQCRLSLPMSISPDGTGIDFGLCRLTFGRDFLLRELTSCETASSTLTRV